MKQKDKTKTFIASLAHQHLSGNTVKAYANAIMRFYMYYDRLTPENLLLYQTLLTERYRPQTANLSIIGMNKYLTYLGKPDWRLPIRKIQNGRFLENVISNREYQRMISYAKQNSTPKHYYVVRALAMTGARVSELRMFRVEHIEQRYLDIVSKGNKLRRIYLPDTLCKELRKWCEKENRVEGPLFVGRNGHPMTTSGIAKCLTKLAEDSGINPKVAHPHSFRHLFAKNFISKKCDLALLADLLGHDSLETTKIYLRCTTEEQQSLINNIVTW